MMFPIKDDDLANIHATVYQRVYTPRFVCQVHLAGCSHWMCPGVLSKSQVLDAAKTKQLATNSVDFEGNINELN